MEDKQKLIDSLAYPPTHTYILDGLQPTGVLAQRLSVLNRLAPDFFTKKGRFLDVGCNKGFFSLYEWKSIFNHRGAFFHYMVHNFSTKL